ncbi:MAG: QueT transporter family protein [Candidatus Bathyarchaeia archaeon]
MRFKLKELSLTVVFAVLYAVAVISLAPISFGVWQVRVADALLPLSIVFGTPCTVGLSLGCIIGNIYGGLGPIDVICGSIANFIACFAAHKIGRRNGVIARFLGSFAETIIISVIVGGYLSYLFNVPLELSIIGVLIGSIIAINAIGFPLEEIMRRIYIQYTKQEN